MRHKPLLTPTMCLILEALTSVDQRLSTATLVEMTGAADSTVLLSSRKLLNNGFITATTIDGIMHYEPSGATATATTAVRK